MAVGQAATTVILAMGRLRLRGKRNKENITNRIVQMVVILLMFETMGAQSQSASFTFKPAGGEFFDADPRRRECFAGRLLPRPSDFRVQ